MAAVQRGDEAGGGSTPRRGGANALDFVPVGFPLGPVETTELALFGALANSLKGRERASIGYHEGEDLVFGINAAMSVHFDEMGDAIACLEGDAGEYLEYRLLESLLPIPPHRHIQQVYGVRGDLGIEIAWPNSSFGHT